MEGGGQDKIYIGRNFLGGSGGGYQGGDGLYLHSYAEYAAYGGTQINPGGLKYGSRTTAKFGEGGSCTGTSTDTAGPGGGGGWYGGAASGKLGLSAAGGSGYVLTSTSFKPDGYQYKREYFLMKASTKNGVRFGNGVIKITLLDNIDNENIKIRGCGISGFSFSQLISFITLPSVV